MKPPQIRQDKVSNPYSRDAPGQKLGVFLDLGELSLAPNR